MPKDGYYLPQRRLVSQDESAIIQDARIPRSKFTNRFGRITAFDAGYLVPFLVDEVLPGDHLSYDVEAYVRMSTPLFPMFSNMQIDTFFFFTPARLTWDNWTRFMGEQVDPDTAIDLTIPQVISGVGGFAQLSIYDHMGVPVNGQIAAGQPLSINALPLRAYNLIYNQWFRDQNIQDSLDANVNTDGPDAVSDYALMRRAKAHDYFTSALPWPQKFTAPTVPLGDFAPIIGIGRDGNGPGPTVGPLATVEEAGGLASYPFYQFASTANGVVIETLNANPNSAPQIYADLSEATGVAINTFRQAFLVQELLERDARGGTRYVELIRSHFGVTNPDFRLQRPEYIGGGSSPLVLTPVAQTAPTAEEPLGALGAAGTSAGQHRASYAATEHGYILGIINVRSELAYQQGLHKMWSRATRYDFYFPSLAGLGEQAILRKEIYATGETSNDDAVFGYQERWHEYRTRYSQITGIMRSTSTGTLDAWHLAQRFTGAPTLSDTFIVDNPPLDRVLAAGELAVGQQFLADIMINRTAVRPIPTFGTPATLGRF